MLSLGIPIDFDDAGNTIVDLNIGRELKARDFPQDSEFQLLAFRPTGKTCKVVWVEELAQDIGEALAELERTGFKQAKSDWYRRLALYCSGQRTLPSS
jgi:hypothetical protein